MPTAFVAEWGAGKSVLAILAEFDALPGLRLADRLKEVRLAQADANIIRHHQRWNRTPLNGSQTTIMRSTKKSVRGGTTRRMLMRRLTIAAFLRSLQQDSLAYWSLSERIQMPNDNESKATKFVKTGDVEKHAATPPPPAVSQSKPGADAQPSQQTQQTKSTDGYSPACGNASQIVAQGATVDRP